MSFAGCFFNTKLLFFRYKQGVMEMIAKGCTCKNTFSIPFAESDIKVIFITYQQKGKTVIEKSLSECTFSEGTVSVILTQEDTLKLDENEYIKIQIRVRLQDGTLTKSKIIETYTDKVLKNEVI